MKLEEMISNLRIELQDNRRDTEDYLYSDSELVRAISKSISLMSRLIPKRSVAEGIVTKSITNEALVIASSTGQLSHNPVSKGSVTITGKVMDIDYTINYITGQITEIGSNLPDGNYTVSYDLDSAMYNLSSILPDYIKIERIEYPAGDYPATYPTFDLYDNYICFRGNTKLADKDHIRIVYLGKWSEPTYDQAGNYPSHLDDPVIIGSAGEALIYKAELYTRKSADVLDSMTTLIASLPDAPDTSSISPPVAPSIIAPIPPDLYHIVTPIPSDLPSIPDPPTVPVLSFTDVHTDLAQVTSELSEGSDLLEAGDDLINAATRGDNVSTSYANFANVRANMASVMKDSATVRLQEIAETLSLYSTQVTAYGSSVNAYANQVSGILNKYTADVNVQELGINNSATAANIYSTQVASNNGIISLYQAKVNAYQAEVSNIQNEVTNYANTVTATVNILTQLASQATAYLDTAGRFLSSGQAKINEMAVMLGVRVEFNYQKAMSEQ